MAVNPNYLYVVLDKFRATAPAYMAMLVNPNYTPNPLNESGVDDAAAYEIPGIPRVQLTGINLGVDVEGLRLHCDDIVFEGIDGTMEIGGIVIYLQTSVEDPPVDAGNLIVCWDLDDGPFTPPPGTLTYMIDDNDGFALFTV